MYNPYYYSPKSIYIYALNKSNFPDLLSVNTYFLKLLPSSNGGRFYIDRRAWIAKDKLPALVLFKYGNYICGSGICDDTGSNHNGGDFIHFIPDTVIAFGNHVNISNLPSSINIQRLYSARRELDVSGLTKLCDYLSHQAALPRTGMNHLRYSSQSGAGSSPFYITYCSDPTCKRMRNLLICEEEPIADIVNSLFSHELNDILDLFRNLTYRSFYYYNTHYSESDLPRILISRERKTREYGKYSVHIIREQVEAALQKCLNSKQDACAENCILRELLKRLQQILWMLDEDEQEYFTYIHEELKALESELKRLEPLPCILNMQDELKRLLKMLYDRYICVSVLGTYEADRNVITFYVCNICSARGGFQENVKQVFAHEMFHALHYHAVLEKFMRNGNYSSVCTNALDYWKNRSGNNHTKTVIESLAAYFEYKWCKQYGEASAADQLYNDLSLRAFPSYPYAGAVALLDAEKLNSSGVFTYSDVFEQSLVDWEAAYRQLEVNRDATR